MNINTNTETPRIILKKINQVSLNINEIYERLKNLHLELDETLDDKLREKIGQNFNKYLEFLKEFVNNQNMTAAKLAKIIDALDEYEKIKIEV